MLFSFEFKTRRVALVFGALYISFITGRYSKYISSALEDRKS